MFKAQDGSTARSSRPSGTVDIYEHVPDLYPAVEWPLHLESALLLNLFPSTHEIVSCLWQDELFQSSAFTPHFVFKPLWSRVLLIGCRDVTDRIACQLRQLASELLRRKLASDVVMYSPLSAI